ncbi:MAG: hypothetical protein WDW38_006458 [Sanguina aurantia]
MRRATAETLRDRGAAQRYEKILRLLVPPGPPFVTVTARSVTPAWCERRCSAISGHTQPLVHRHEGVPDESAKCLEGRDHAAAPCTALFERLVVRRFGRSSHAEAAFARAARRCLLPWLKTLDASVAAVGRWPRCWRCAVRHLESWHADIEDFRLERGATSDAACKEAMQQIKNPYYIRDQPGLTQTSGWADAWLSQPSAYAVAAETTADVVAAVNFAREHHLRLVVKGGGHSYQGTSDAPDSLLQATSNQTAKPQNVIEAGALWIDAYDAVTTVAGRYVQGGGCTTVGVAGLVQSGGFGNFSKQFGTAAAGLIEAEVVTADGSVRIANAHQNPELFWGLKGGGGGSLGVMGLQDVFFKLRLPFDSAEALALSTRIAGR